MGVASRRRAVTVYSEATVMAQYQELWAELLAQTPKEEHLQNRPKAHLEQPNYYSTFKHFATRSISLDAIIEEGCTSESCLKAAASSLHPAIARPLSVRPIIVEQIYNLLKTRGPLSLQNIIQHLQSHWPSDEIIRESMWAVKYGFFSVRSSPD